MFSYPLHINFDMKFILFQERDFKIMEFYNDTIFLLKQSRYYKHDMIVSSGKIPLKYFKMISWTYTLKIKTLNQSNTYKNGIKRCI